MTLLDREEVASSRGLDRSLRVAFGFLAAAIVLAPELFASATTPFLAPVCGLVFAAAAAAAASPESTALRHPARVLVAVVGVLVLYTLVQLVPWPMAALERIAPFSAEAWSRALHPLDRPAPPSAPITLDPFGTWSNVQRGMLYALTLIATLRVARSREGARAVEGAIVSSVVLLAIVSLVHGLGEIQEVFGVYTPEQGALGRHSGPVFNANHLGGFITIGFSVVFGWSLAPDPPMPRVLAFALAAGLLATQVWIASRGATSALAVAAALVAVGSWHARHRGDNLGLVGAAMAVAVAVGLAMIVLGSSDGAWNELLDPGLDKIDDIKATLRLVPRAPVTGVGRGAFEGAYPAVQERAVHMDWEAPESLVPHWLCEWGVPVTVLALGAIAYALRLRYVYERAVPPVGPWVAVMAVALQNMGDFGSEVPSLGILCSACAGVVVAGNRGRTLTRTERRGWKLVVWTVGLSLAVLSYDLGTKGSHEIALDRRISRARILDPGATSARADEAYVAAALRHPAEPYFAYIRAYRAAYERTPDLLRWVAHTLERDPHHGGAALMLARTLVDKNPAQARDAYRRAATDDPALVDQAIREGLRLVRSYDHALELVPRGENDARRAGLGVLVRALATRMPATTLAFEEALARIDAGDPSLLERRAARALAALRMRMPWCEGDGLARCVDDARIAARDIQSRSPERCHGYAIEAEALLLAGFADAGVSGLRAAFDRVADRADCNLRLVDLAGKAGLRQILTEALDELTAGACLDPNGCVGRLMALASLELAHGNPGRAFSAYERAHAVEPENVVITEGLAGLASRLGRHRQAIAAYAAVVEAKPDRADLRDALKREQRLLTEQIAHDPTALP